MTARLLREEEARRYLGGADPRAVMTPIRIGSRIFWDRLALDEWIDRASGRRTKTAPAPTPSALSAWEAEQDGAA